MKILRRCIKSRIASLSSTPGKLLLVLTFFFGLQYVYIYQEMLLMKKYLRWPMNYARSSIFEKDFKSRCFPKRGSRAGADCSAIFEDSEYTLKHHVNYTPSIEPGCELDELVKDCSRLREAHGYDFIDQLSKADTEYFPIAYAMKVHKSPEQAEQLLRAIYHPHNVYCIHVDKKSPVYIQNLFFNISRCFDNVHVIEKNVNVGYATFDMIVAEMMSMSLCRNVSSSWKYYINLTGQEFPLKTNWEIIQILKLLNGTNDIESYQFDEEELQGRILYFVKLPFPHDIKPFKGSAYGMFSRKFVDFILDSPIAKEIIEYFKNTKAPEETIWSTLHRVPEAPGGLSMNTRHDEYQQLAKAVIWLWDKATCNGKFVRAVCVYGVRDLMWLRSRPEIFANKFDTDYDRLAIDCMEEEIQNRSHTRMRRFLNFDFYRHLPQVLHT